MNHKTLVRVLFIACSLLLAQQEISLAQENLEITHGPYLVEPGDYRAFVDRIHAFYRLSPAAQQAKADEARAYVQREYAWEQAAERYLELFTS